MAYVANLRTSEVFGISVKPNEHSYIDRGQLDEEIRRHLPRDIHLALRGESKIGKSWLRQRVIPDALVVQCRLSKDVTDIYVDALSQLDVKLELSRDKSSELRGSVKAKGSFGIELLAKVGIDSEISTTEGESSSSKYVGHDIDDLRFVVDIIKASGRQLVIEDFHYLTIERRAIFAFDLKALWDYGLFVVVIGVWSQSNMLLHLNSDLSGRVHEVPIDWSDDDLERVIEKGAEALNLSFSHDLIKKLVELSVGNVGILQKLTLLTLDALKIDSAPPAQLYVSDLNALETAALQYAEQLNPLYQEFARNVSSGIRTRKNSTGIYAHAMSVIISASDKELASGIKAREISERANARQPRIQYGNLKVVLEKIEELQIDEGGRGLVISYNHSTEDVTVVDRQLLLYRRYCTVKWPWEDLIAEVGEIIED